MNTITIPKKEYQSIIQKQLLFEKEITFLKKSIFEFNEVNIFPDVLQRWERISQDIDNKKGHSFSSVGNMKKWLKNI